MQRSEGFPPIVQTGARVLILGSLPGRRSLADREYYAHPQNAFWPIMKELFAVSGDYDARTTALRVINIALWDVLQASVRPGSLDSSIRLETAAANDFVGFLREYPAIEKIVFNGKKAQQLFRRLVPQEQLGDIETAALPSTSPAYAAMPFDVKLSAWRSELALLRHDT